MNKTYKCKYCKHLCLQGYSPKCKTCIYSRCKSKVDEKLLSEKWSRTLAHASSDWFEALERFYAWYNDYFGLNKK